MGTAQISVDSTTAVAPMRIFLKVGQMITFGTSRIADYQVLDDEFQGLHIRFSHLHGGLFVETCSPDETFLMDGAPRDRARLTKSAELAFPNTTFTIAFPHDKVSAIPVSRVDAKKDTTEFAKIGGESDPFPLDPTNVLDDEFELATLAESTVGDADSKIGPDELVDVIPNAVVELEDDQQENSTVEADDSSLAEIGDAQNYFWTQSERYNVLYKFHSDDISVGVFERLFDLTRFRMLARTAPPTKFLKNQEIGVTATLNGLTVYALGTEPARPTVKCFFNHGVVLLPTVTDDVFAEHIEKFKINFKSRMSIRTRLLQGAAANTLQKMECIGLVIIPSDESGWDMFSTMTADQFKSCPGLAHPNSLTIGTGQAE